MRVRGERMQPVRAGVQWPMPDPKPDTPADEEGDPKPTDLPEQKIPGKPISDMDPPGQDEPEAEGLE
jgi:hypothetical protein